MRIVLVLDASTCHRPREVGREGPADYKESYALTMSPLIVKDKFIIDRGR